MFDKFVRSAEDIVADRMSSPILGPFGISWSLWNYKYLIILVSKNSVSESFKLADRLLYPDWWHLWSYWLVLPAITTLLYIYVYPLAVERVLNYSLHKKAAIDSLRRKHDDGTIMPYEEGRRLKATLREMETEHSVELAKKDDQIKSLRARLDRDRERTSKVVLADSSQKLSELKRELLVTLGKDSGSMNLGDLIKVSHMKKVELEFNMEELSDGGYVDTSYGGTGSPIYSLTQLGRAVALGKATPTLIRDE